MPLASRSSERLRSALNSSPASRRNPAVRQSPAAPCYLIWPDREKSANQHCKLVDRLRALIALAGCAREQAIGFTTAAELHVFGAHCDLYRLPRPTPSHRPPRSCYPSRFRAYGCGENRNCVKRVIQRFREASEHRRIEDPARVRGCFRIGGSSCANMLSMLPPLPVPCLYSRSCCGWRRAPSISAGGANCPAMRSRNNMPATNAPGTDETTGAHCETLRLLTAAYDAVDGSSARHVSAIEVGATKAPMIRRSYPCKRSRRLVST
jgi:hypothetical protein